MFLFCFRKLFIIYHKRNKRDLIEKIKNFFKEESNEVNIIDVENNDKDNDSNFNYEDDYFMNNEDININDDNNKNKVRRKGKRSKDPKDMKLPHFKNHYSFLSTNLFDNINLHDLKSNVYEYDIFKLYNTHVEMILLEDNKDITIDDEPYFYETFEYFFNVLCLLYFLKNIYFDLNYKTNENSYSFLFKGFEERKK